MMAWFARWTASTGKHVGQADAGQVAGAARAGVGTGTGTGTGTGIEIGTEMDGWVFDWRRLCHNMRVL